MKKVVIAASIAGVVICAARAAFQHYNNSQLLERFRSGAMTSTLKELGGDPDDYNPYLAVSAAYRAQQHPSLWSRARRVFAFLGKFGKDLLRA